MYMQMLAFSLVALIALTGCAGSAFSSAEVLPAQPVDNTLVASTLRYQHGFEEGPLYNFSVEVPEAWVGEMQTRNEGNRVIFEFIVTEAEGIVPTRAEPIFVIEALSESQYWMQIGSYPGQFETLVNAYDTYFVLQQAIDDFNTGIDEFLTAIPDQINLSAGEADEVVGDPLSDVTDADATPQDMVVSAAAQNVSPVRMWISTYMPSIRNSFEVARAEPLQ